MYSNEDINNEKIPFEDDISIKNKDRSINLFPNSLLNILLWLWLIIFVIADGNSKKK